MKRFCYLLLMLLCFSGVRAQQQDDKHERIRALKISFLTERLKLSEEQASRFWPVYNRYETERRSIRKSFYQKYKAEHPGQDEATARKFLDDNIEYQEQDLALKKRYKDEMLKTISAQQLAELYQAERDFRKMLIDQLKDRK